MNKIRAYVGYNDYNKTHYYKDFKIKEELPKIGDSMNGPIVIKINEMELDCENSDEVYKYRYYEIVEKYEDEEDDEENYYYDYIAIEMEEK